MWQPSASSLSTWLFTMLTQAAQPPPTSWPPHLHEEAPFTLFFLYHNCDGMHAVHRWQQHQPQTLLRAIGLQIVAKVPPCNCTSGPASCTKGLQAAQNAAPRLADIAPWFSTSLGIGLQNILAEDAAITALSASLATFKCAPGKRCWVGTASWKATGVKRSYPDCINLLEIANDGAKISSLLSPLPNDATLYWQGNASSSHHKRDLPGVRHISAIDYPGDNYLVNAGMRRIFTEFFEEALGLNYTSLYMRALIPSVGSVYSLPLANWYLAPPHIYQTLSKLKVLMFSWFQSRYPIEAVGCPMFPHDFMNRSMAGGGFSIARCWAFIGEQLTVMYLTAETSLYLLSGCEGEELQRWRSDFAVEKGLLTKHVHKLYEEVSRAAPNVEEAVRRATEGGTLEALRLYTQGGAASPERLHDPIIG